MVELFVDETQRRKAVDDFKREAQLLASLDHPSIPTIFDYFISADGRYYLVMKYIGGGDLQGQLKKRGGVIEERIQLNENTVWAGPPVPAQPEDAAVHLAEARRLFFGGKPEEGQARARGGAAQDDQEPRQEAGPVQE